MWANAWRASTSFTTLRFLCQGWVLLQVPAILFPGSQRSPVQSRAPCWPAVDMLSECEVLRVCYSGTAQPILTVTLTPTGNGFTTSPLVPRGTANQWGQPFIGFVCPLPCLQCTAQA